MSLFDAEANVFVNDRAVQAAIVAWELALSQTSLYKWLKEGAVAYLQDATDARFSTEGDAASGKWADLKPATEDIRDALGYPRSHPINIREGKLEDWLLNNTGSLRMFGAKSAELVWPGPAPLRDELIDKFEVAQRGIPFPATVARPVVAADVGDLAELLEDLREHLLWEAGAYMYAAVGGGSAFDFTSEF